MTIARWLAFCWLIAAVAIMGYFTWRFAVETTNPYRDELTIGHGLGAMFGAPAFIALPALMYCGRRDLGRRAMLLFAFPVVAAVLIVIVHAAIST